MSGGFGLHRKRGGGGGGRGRVNNREGANNGEVKCYPSPRSATEYENVRSQGILNILGCGEGGRGE